ncbi:MAG: hypothetical protein WC562_00585 [Dehalococcoidia bacterium]
MNKRGTTLIETLISIFLISSVVLTLLEALNVGITGTLNLSRKTSALNLAKSQMEYVKVQKYINASGDFDDTYGNISPNISDITNYTIDGEVEVLGISQSLQKITVNVNYMAGKEDVELIGYKIAEGNAFTSAPPAKGNLVSDVIQDMPFESPGGWALGCWGFLEWLLGEQGCGTWTGYYRTITTSQEGYISATWGFNWTNEFANTIYGYFTWGAPFIGIYAGVPDWAQRDYLDQPYPDGVVFRPGSDTAWDGGCMPGCGCDPDVPGDYAPIVKAPSGCHIDEGVEQWTYEHNCWFLGIPCDKPATGYYEFTVKTASPQPAGTYTVLFFNGEDRVSFETVTAAVTYVY